MIKIHPPRKSASKDAIIDEALSLAAEKGWGSVTVRAIANRLGYAPPVLYAYFKNKDHLIENILNKGFDILNSRMEKAMAKSSTPEDQLIAISLERFSFALDEPAFHSLMYATGCPSWHRQTVFQAMCQIRGMVQILIRKISGRDDDCLDLITNYIAIIKGYTYFATELPKDLSDKKFFGGLAPKKALQMAMTRFIYSIKQND